MGKTDGSDKKIVGRLFKYATPFWKDFAVVFVIMLLSIGHNILSPLLVGRIEELVKADFDLTYLFTLVGIYGGILLVSLVCTYFQAILLQKIGQKIQYIVFKRLSRKLHKVVSAYNRFQNRVNYSS